MRELSSRKESTHDHERRQSLEGKGSRRRLVFAVARQAPRRLTFSGSLRFTITDTVNFDLADVALTKTAWGAGAFSLPERTTRFCSANRDGLADRDAVRGDFSIADLFLVRNSCSEPEPIHRMIARAFSVCRTGRRAFLGRRANYRLATPQGLKRHRYLNTSAVNGEFSNRTHDRKEKGRYSWMIRSGF